jgi:hypothetical protein
MSNKAHALTGVRFDTATAPDNVLSGLDLTDKWLGEGIEPLLEAVPDPRLYYIVITQVAIKKKVGNIILPDQAVADQDWTHGLGMVVKVGPSVGRGRRFEDLGDVEIPEPGDLLTFRAGASPIRYRIDGRLFLVITDDSVICKVDRKHLHRIKFTV